MANDNQEKLLVSIDSTLKDMLEELKRQGRFQSLDLSFTDKKINIGMLNSALQEIQERNDLNDRRKNT